MAKFRVHKKLVLEAFPYPVLAGEVVSGSIIKGMFAKVPVDAGLFQIAPVLSIEFIDYPNNESDVALVLYFDVDDSREMFFRLCEAGDIIDVTNATLQSYQDRSFSFSFA